MIKFLEILFVIPILIIIDAWFYFKRLYDFASDSYDKQFKKGKRK